VKKKQNQNIDKTASILRFSNMATSLGLITEKLSMRTFILLGPASGTSYTPLS